MERTYMGQRTVAAALVLLTLALYAPALRHDFVVYDDPAYVVDNPHVRAGLSVDGFRWALTSMEASNWHPLTWLSHMADCQLFGMNAGGHHATSAAIHTVTALLLFILLRRTTGALWLSAFVAALFAWHPLHVESVAWVAERKDILSGLFFMLTLLAYVRYAERPSVRRYAVVAGLFALGLMAKAMLVTLPLILLLLDVWPLRRTGERLVIEKLPLLGLSAAAAGVTYVAQSAGGALLSLNRAPIASRLANAIVSPATYLRQTFWPSGLAVFYPYDVAPEPMSVAIAAAVLGAVSVAAWSVRRLCPPVLVGWLWFLCMLAPVIGLVQAGEQRMADRYTYLPLVGVFIMAAWGGAALTGPPSTRKAFVAMAVVALAGCLALARAQLAHWRDSVTLFRRAIEVTPLNPVAHLNLGSALLDRGDVAGAAGHYLEAARQRPDWFPAVFNAGVALATLDRHDAATHHLRAAVRLEPTSAPAHLQLGLVLERQGQRPEAMQEYREALRLAPGDRTARERLEALDQQRHPGG